MVTCVTPRDHAQGTAYRVGPDEFDPPQFLVQRETSHLPARHRATGTMTRKQPRATKYKRRQKHDQGVDLDRHGFDAAGAFQDRHLPPHLDAHPEQWNEHGEENPRNADDHYAEHGPFRQPSHLILQGACQLSPTSSRGPILRRIDPIAMWLVTCCRILADFEIDA